MACSRYEYVKAYETHETLLPNTWAVVRVDGRAFTRLTSVLSYTKPNDAEGLAAMNAAAAAVMSDMPDLVLGYGQSDEYSFLLRRGSVVFGRRREKILTTVVSVFSAAFVRAVGEEILRGERPSFDGRVVVYPGEKEVRDYFAWRQADCHVNNLFNSAFWCLVQRGGRERAQAEKELRGTSAADKNELLFAGGVNYNEEPAIFRKGSVMVRLKKGKGKVEKKSGSGRERKIVVEREECVECPESNMLGKAEELGGSGQMSNGSDSVSLDSSVTIGCTCCAQSADDTSKFSAVNVVLCHADIIRNAFWNRHPNILQ